ncbi:MAG: zinc-binding dehydrogenase [Firmicutes bacterium]|nr:zinc-binding dehydrogenase [Alicyclobacillaceae bacterium]MCL6497337.1 zinc-binding dehydrogenase [Bacillota bacterium]
MRAAVVPTYGAPIQWETVPDPVPGPGEAVVQVQAVSINRSLDVEVHDTGAGWPVRRFPFWTGADPAGTVVAVGSEVDRVRVGDRVVAYPFLYDGTCPYCLRGQETVCQAFGVIGVHRNGGEAELVALPARNLWRLPDDVPFETAAAAAVTYGVAWDLLVVRARVQPGETVLVWGASGGMGSAAVDILRLAGCDVIAVTSTEAGGRLANTLGAKATINRSQQSVADEVLRLTEGRGVDVVFENIGSATFATSLNVLAREGRLVTSGSALSGPHVSLDIRQLYRKHVQLIFSAAYSPRWVPTLLDLLRTGRLHPHIGHRLPLSEAEAGQAIVRAGQNLGKVVLVAER